MSRKIYLSMVLLMFSLYGLAQSNINNYKYIIIPQKFDFLKSNDQYQLNSLTKFLFNKYGYEAYFMEDDLPKDLEANRCLGLTAVASNEKSGLFKTKIDISLKDCFGKTVVTSKIGESRLKEYDKAYTEAIREAFETFKTLNYAYNPTETDSKQEKSADIKPKDPEPKREVTDTQEVVEAKSNSNIKEELFYAQPIENGFQLVNAEPKIVMILLETAADYIFLVKGKSAIVYKEDGFWYYSENIDGLKDKKRLNIKF